MPASIDATTFWIVVSALGSCIAVSFGLWWAHVQKCNDRAKEEGIIKEKVTSIEREIGDNERGIIGQLHRYSKAITRLFAKLGMGE